MNSLIVNCIDIVGPADIEPLLAMATRSSDDHYDKCYVLARNLDLVTEMVKEDNSPIRSKLINRLSLAFLGIITYSSQFKCYQVYQVSLEGVTLHDENFDANEIAANDL